MPFGPLETWDDSTLDDVCTSDETTFIERKSGQMFDTSTKGWKDKVNSEIAKQLSAFSNSATGHLVFGFSEKPTVALDVGVPSNIGREPIKDWMEALAPKLLEPPLHGVQARFIRREGFHATDRGVLVVEIPLSSARPHWVKSEINVAHIRAGAHSAPMSHHTFLDMASRQSSPTGAVYELETKGIGSVPDGVFPLKYWLRPTVGLAHGPVCKEWCVELKVDPTKGTFESHPDAVVADTPHLLSFIGREPLFPGRRVVLGGHQKIVLRTFPNSEVNVEVVLYAGSASPVTRSFSLA
jgi:hypothetical protein